MEATDISKPPFDIHDALDRVENAVKQYPKAAMFELADEGYDSPFEQLIACLISIRTRDEMTMPTARRLFAEARTAKTLSQLAPERIASLIQGCSFHERKAGQIQAIAQEVVEEHNGELPCDRELMLSFAGIGPKCANLALGVACEEAHISVDIHVHRITNRWGYVATKTPEKTMVALQEKLPRDYWVTINCLLVPFGKHICTGRAPRCSVCPVQHMCQQKGVKSFR